MRAWLAITAMAMLASGCPDRRAPKGQRHDEPAKRTTPSRSRRHASHEHGHGHHPHARGPHHHHPHPHPHLDGPKGHHHPY